MIQIEVPRGARGVRLEQTGMGGGVISSEGEVLFPRNTKLRVVSVGTEQVPGSPLRLPVVHAELVVPPPRPRTPGTNPPAFPFGGARGGTFTPEDANALKAKIAREGMTPENQAQFDAMSAEVFATATPEYAAPPPPVRPGGVGQRIGQAITGEVQQAPADLATSRQQVMDALAGEVRLRRSGIVADEIAAGRSRQAAGIAGNLETAQRVGATLDERLQGARAGARTGSLRKTFGEPLELTEDAKTALADHLQTNLAGRQFDQLNGLDALNRLLKGENVQPAQLKLLGRVFGPDFAKLAGEANAGRITAVAELGDDAQKIIAGALKGEKAIVTLEQKALAQAKLADDLMARHGMEPTNARLKAVAVEARERGLRFANEADELTMRQSRAYQQAIEAQNTKARLGQEATARANNTAVTEQIRADRLNPDEEQLIAQAKAMLGEVPGTSSAVDREAIKSVEYWVKGARQYRESIGETTHTALSKVASYVTGNLADSYLTTLYQNRLVAARALEMSGTDPVVAKKVADLLVQSQLKARYPGGVPQALEAEVKKIDALLATRPGGVAPDVAARVAQAKADVAAQFPGGVPQRILDEIEKTKGLAYGGPIDETLKGMAAFSQEWKNLAFGPLDFGILGQQGLKATTEMGPINIVTGLANRLLAKMGHPLFDDPLLAAPTDAARRLQYARDGLAVGVNTGAVQPAEGIGLLGRLGPAGRAAEKWIDLNSRIQFDKVLGGLRNLDHEGNLAILNFLGRDITDPAVRATSARFANVATAYSPPALNARRAAVETATMMTPSMRRAQVEGIMQVAKAIAPKSGATAEERLLGSILILNKYVVRTGIGLTLNHYFGIGDYVWDQSQRGYGMLTTKLQNRDGQNIVVGISPQDQVENAVLQSIRYLAESDPAEAAKAWGKLGMGTSGPALQIAEKAAGYGFQPGKGYRFGDFGKGMTPGQRALASGIVPIPPVVQSGTQGTMSPQTAPLDVAGVANYPESSSAVVERGAYGGLTGKAQFEAIKPQAWRDVQEKAPPNLKPMLAEYDSLYDWYQAAYDVYEQKAITAGKSPAEAKRIAASKTRSHPVYEAYLRNRTLRTNQWVRANPEVAREMDDDQADLPERERSFKPTKPQRAVIGAVSGE